MSLKDILCKWLLVLAVLPITACSEAPSQYMPRQEIYDSAFDPSHVELIVEVIDRFAEKQRLEIIMKDKEQAKFLSYGTPAFSIFLYSGDDPLFHISNVGVGTVISVSVSYYDRFKNGEVESMRDLLFEKLERAVDLDFVKVKFERSN